MEGKKTAEQKRRTVMNILRFICFAGVFCVIFLYLSSVFTIPATHMTRRFNTFYAEQDDTIDAVYLGSSAVDRYFATPRAWNNHGITVYPLSSNVQTIAAAKYLMEEAVKTQTPKVFIVEVRGCKKKTESNIEACIRVLTDQMKFSFTRIKLINALLEYNDISATERFDYYFSLLKYHDIWGDGLNENGFTGGPFSAYKGFYISNESTTLTVQYDEPVYTDERMPLEDGVEEALRDLIVYSREMDYKVLFVASPYVMSDTDRKRLNTVSDILAEYDCDFINFNDVDKELPELDYSHDFYNEDHVNIYGAEQYTDYLSKYLIENYKLTDRRGIISEESEESWNAAYAAYKKKIKKLKKNSRTMSAEEAQKLKEEQALIEEQESVEEQELIEE